MLVNSVVEPIAAVCAEAASRTGLITFVSAGQVERFAETLCEAPLIVNVAEHVCEPVPSGGATPVSFTVNCHCVPPGVSTELLARFMLNVPVTSAVAR